MSDLLIKLFFSRALAIILMIAPQIQAAQPPGSDYTAQVAAAIVDFNFRDIPPEILNTADTLIADSLAVTVGAHHIALLNQLESILEVDGGESLILHSGRRGS
ncbi:MAG: hypothetical protein VW202_07415, partial [Halieaceae bacterium]